MRDHATYHSTFFEVSVNTPLLLETVHGLHENLGLPVDEAHVLDDLVLRVEQLDALRVRVVARSEGARVRSGEFPGKRRPF